MKPEIHLVVMAGGSGTRFWPKSTSKKPKQLLSFGKVEGGISLLQQTLKRFDKLVAPDCRMIVTTKALEDSVVGEAPSTHVLAEPQGRNTAPCIYWAARAIAEKNPRALMLVMPSDHYIARPERFIETVSAACSWASEHDDLVTLGIQPDRPETGYGYLKIAGKGAPAKVDAFVEKPNLERAKVFLASGNYLWNGGMFVWRAEVILRAFDEFMPEMKAAWESAGGRVETAYPKMTATSIDYGIMEKAKNVVSFPLDCGWDDLGSWTSLEGLADVLKARHAAGVVSGGEALAIDATGNIVDAPGKMVTLLGVKDLIVVEHGGAILVADKNRAQDIKLIVEQLKKQKPELV
jgi:mannose-1-phosphate guanylyltransferase